MRYNRIALTKNEAPMTNENTETKEVKTSVATPEDVTVENEEEISAPNETEKLEEEKDPRSENSAPTPAPIPLFGHKFGLIDVVAFTLAATLIVCSQIFTSSLCRWTLSISAIGALLIPGLIQRIRLKNAFGIGAIYSRCKRMNLNPQILGNEIHWKVGETEHVLRVFGRGQLQFVREYPANPENSKLFTAAATATMSQIFSAKVGVKDEGENIFFSTEMLCSSIKEFDKLFPACESILDAAEERQRVNFKEALEAKRKVQKRIGFVQGYKVPSEESAK